MRKDETKKGAAILRFPSRRGRPRKNAPLHDTGTPELIMKRLKGETAEALDLCLERAIITPKQHWCGIHLRWLYTLRFGAPGVRAIDPTHFGGMELKDDDPDWRSAREQEYHEAIATLHHKGRALVLMNLCIYNERPRFLARPESIAPARAHAINQSIIHLRDGLEILVKHWSR